MSFNPFIVLLVFYFYIHKFGIININLRPHKYIVVVFIGVDNDSIRSNGLTDVKLANNEILDDDHTTIEIIRGL